MDMLILRPLASASLRASALELRERQVLGYLVQGDSVKVTAYALGSRRRRSPRSRGPSC
jgi:hypothetical protein